MLAIGRALMSRPKLLLLDEPSFGLAPQVVHAIFHILATIRKANDVSILLVSRMPRSRLLSPTMPTFFRRVASSWRGLPRI